MLNKTLLFKTMGLDIAGDFDAALRRILADKETGNPSVTQDMYLESWDKDTLTVADMFHTVAVTTGQHVHIMSCTGDNYKWAARFEKQGHITETSYASTLDKAMVLLVIQTADQLSKQ